MNDPRFWLFLILFIAIVFAIKFLHDHNLKFDYKITLLYVSFYAMVGPMGEVVVGSSYHALVGQPLWQYKIGPIHHGYTSLIAPLLWGVAGLHLSFTKKVMIESLSYWRGHIFAAIYTMFFEGSMNVLGLLLVGTYLFWYLPTDLWHATSLQTVPFYFILSIVSAKAIKSMSSNCRFFSLMCITISIAFVYIA